MALSSADTVARAWLLRLAIVMASLGVAAACKNPAKPDCPAATTWDGAKCAASVAPSAGSSAVASAPTPSVVPSALAPSARSFEADLGMVRIPSGDFQMGANDISPSEKPVHPVHVDAFEMDVTEVTLGQYGACVAAGSCSPAKTGLPCNGGRKNRTNHPVNCVDLDRATAYCAWAGKRLPTEEEWEYAARGTDGRKYPWGNDPPAPRACWHRNQGTCPVASYPKGDSPFGLHDMVGNVAEWTSSFFSEGYDKPRDKKNRVVRGGAWFTAETMDGTVDMSSADPATRWLGMPREADNRYGVRCAR